MLHARTYFASTRWIVNNTCSHSLNRHISAFRWVPRLSTKPTIAYIVVSLCSPTPDPSSHFQLPEYLISTSHAPQNWAIPLFPANQHFLGALSSLGQGRPAVGGLMAASKSEGTLYHSGPSSPCLRPLVAPFASWEHPLAGRRSLFRVGIGKFAIWIQMSGDVSLILIARRRLQAPMMWRVLGTDSRWRATAAKPEVNDDIICDGGGS